MSQQQISRLGNSLGIMDVTGDVINALAATSTYLTLMMQILGTLGVGGVVGILVAKLIKIIELPQMVAAFNSLVGLDAVYTSIAAFMSTSDTSHLDAILKISTYIGTCTFVVAVSLTESDT